MTDHGGDARLPAQVEAGALMRRVQQEGGFAAVLAKGDPDAGSLLVILVENGACARAFERMPHPSGTRRWTLARAADPEQPEAFGEWLDRRRHQDPDLWIIELDIPQGERFIP